LLGGVETRREPRFGLGGVNADPTPKIPCFPEQSLELKSKRMSVAGQKDRGSIDPRIELQ